MNTEIEFYFNNKKHKDNLLVTFNDDLGCWKITTENNKDFNQILALKMFKKTSDIINYLRKSKIKFNTKYFNNLKLPHIKSFFFDFDNSYGVSGSDDLNNINVIYLKFKDKLSYFYTSEHDLQYRGFDSYWKFQHEEDGAKIWQHIRSLDRSKYICFNDIYDKCDNDYYNSDTEYDSILEYAKKYYDNDKYLIIKFCYLFEKIIDNEENANSKLRSYNSEFILKCISDFYLYENDFYESEIKISNSDWEYIEKELGKTSSILYRNANLLAHKLPLKNIKEKQTKI